jgi:hypothetical protein
VSCQFVCPDVKKFGGFFLSMNGVVDGQKRFFFHPLTVAVRRMSPAAVANGSIPTPYASPCLMATVCWYISSLLSDPENLIRL